MIRRHKILRYVPALFLMACLSACQGGGTSVDKTATLEDSMQKPLPDTSAADPVNPTVVSEVPSAPSSDPEDPVNTPPAAVRVFAKDVLLFNGTGVSTSDWQSTEQIIKSQGMSYQLVNSAQLSAMTLDEIANFGTLVVPGGSGGSIYGGVSADARLRIRQAVRERGVGYVGFCAGAWVAVGPEAETTKAASYGFAVAKGNVLSLFHPNGQTPTAAMVEVSFADGSHRDLVWWGGPSTPEWAGGVVAKYDTGEPAISETFSGKGLVIISGPHPEAPQGWRATAGNDSDGLDYDIAIKMIQGAIQQKPLEAF